MVLKRASWSRNAVLDRAKSDDGVAVGGGESTPDEGAPLHSGDCVSGFRRRCRRWQPARPTRAATAQVGVARGEGARLRRCSHSRCLPGSNDNGQI